MTNPIESNWSNEPPTLEQLLEAENSLIDSLQRQISEAQVRARDLAHAIRVQRSGHLVREFDASRRQWERQQQAMSLEELAAAHAEEERKRQEKAQQDQEYQDRVVAQYAAREAKESEAAKRRQLAANNLMPV